MMNAGGDLYGELKRCGGRFKDKNVARDILLPCMLALQYCHQKVLLPPDHASGHVMPACPKLTGMTTIAKSCPQSSKSRASYSSRKVVTAHCQQPSSFKCRQLDMRRKQAERIRPEPYMHKPVICFISSSSHQHWLYLCMHVQGVIHRDIKPENILLTQHKHIRLADFGLSIDATLERPVTRAGTLDYMAPEVRKFVGSCILLYLLLDLSPAVLLHLKMQRMAQPRLPVLTEFCVQFAGLTSHCSGFQLAARDSNNLQHNYIVRLSSPQDDSW